MFTNATPTLRQHLIRALLALALALTALTALTTTSANAATLNCWVKGAYLTQGQLGTWNNTVGHRVVCNAPTDVTTRLYRYRQGSWSVVRQYTFSGNTVPALNNYLNQATVTAPLFGNEYYYVDVFAAARYPHVGTTSYGQMYTTSAARSLRAADAPRPPSKRQRRATLRPGAKPVARGQRHP
jgi:hypothetical protein